MDAKGIRKYAHHRPTAAAAEKRAGPQTAARASAARAGRSSRRLCLPGLRRHRLTCIGTDEREVLEYVPSHFKVIVHARPKMSCRDCETITQPPMPSLPIERGHARARACSRMCWWRNTAIICRCIANPTSTPASGVDLERSTLADWVGQMAFLLRPLAEAIGAHVRAGETIACRRYAGAGARSRPRPDQNRPTMGCRAR